MKHKFLRSLGVLALATAATSGFAQSAPAGMVERGDVKTWVITVDGKDYEARPLTPTFSGSSGLFWLPSAYTVAKGKTSFSLYRNNLDRNPKDLDASTIGVTLGYGLSSKAELFGTFGFQRNDVDAPGQAGFVNDFPKDRSFQYEKKLTTTSLEHLSGGTLTYKITKRRRHEA